MDFKIFKTMASQCFQGNISLELYPQVDTPEDAEKESLNYLRPIFQEAGLRLGSDCNGCVCFSPNDMFFPRLHMEAVKNLNPANPVILSKKYSPQSSTFYLPPPSPFFRVHP